MTFAEPTFLLHLCWLIPLLVTLIIWTQLKRKTLKAQLIKDDQLRQQMSQSVSDKKRLFKNVLLLFGVIFIFIALAKPVSSMQNASASIASKDVIIVFDCSKSMTAKDIAPSRLDHGVQLCKDLVDQSTDRFGLISFAGNSFPECPITSNKNAIKLYLDELNAGNLTGGSNIEAALRLALKSFDQKST